MPKYLPTSTATFRKIVHEQRLYIDKTKYLYQLANDTGAFFLSRPRRFGKSLLVSTMEELFMGNRELFRGLWIDSSDYSWLQYPVIRIDFSRYVIDDAETLKKRLPLYFQRTAQQYNFELALDSYDVMFEELLIQLSARHEGRQVVILIDEYDKPLIDQLDNLPEAQKIRSVLKKFYGLLKAMESKIRLTFITGISKFSKVSIFSELNHLKDLTFDNHFANMLGITHDELVDNFQDYLPAFAAKEELSVEQLLEKIRYWYDGFRFTAEGESLYNPFSTMNLFDQSRFSNYWFESGTPTFLIKLLHQRNYDIEQLNHTKVEEIAFSTYDIPNLSLIPLLFQTGYLTIKNYDKAQQIYELGYPNYEVEKAFVTYLLDAFSNQEQGISTVHAWHLIDALQRRDLKLFFTTLKIFFANIDYSLYVDDEKYYQTIFYLIFTMIGLRIEAEVQTNNGRIDAVVEVVACIYIFEFKINKDGKIALKQIQDRAYYQKYQLRGKPILAVGANFNTKTRTVDDWQSEEIEPL